MTAYGRGYGTAAWRKVPVWALDRLRDLAADAHWQAAAAPYRAEVAGDQPLYFVPVWHALDGGGIMRERHPHPLRVQEVADKHGGWVRVGWSTDPVTEKLPPLDPRAALRSRWRRSAYRIYRAYGPCVEEADDFLCQVADCCRYSLWQYSTEYRPWMRQVSITQVVELEDACRDVELPEDEGVL
ncbi:hypothetical protein [Sinorhizobium fredii]|uniref:hypothetical protein n=1 Tax=Rhizobium fredii TaxID=380 RepID=UPI00351395F6